MRKLFALSLLFGAISVVKAASVNGFDLKLGQGSFLYSGGAYSPIVVPGSQETRAQAINDAGQIAGFFLDSTGGFHGFLDNAGSFTTIDVPGATRTFAYGLNDAGQIVGYFVDSTGNHGFLDNAGSFTTIDVPGATEQTLPTGINDTGQIVGFFTDRSVNHGFLDNAGSFTTIDVPGATDGGNFGINNDGQIVGSFDKSGAHGFLYNGGSFTTFDVPGATGGTSARGINHAGQIVGYFYDSNGIHGFLDNAGSFTAIDVPVPGAYTVYTLAYGLNDAGQIVGQYSAAIPEPGSILLLGLGLAGICTVTLQRTSAQAKGRVERNFGTHARPPGERQARGGVKTLD